VKEKTAPMILIIDERSMNDVGGMSITNGRRAAW
jgi:hypothetical protein